MSSREHFREAERLLDSAEQWMDGDRGWMAGMSTEERLGRRTADLTAAAAHGLLAVAAALGADAEHPDDTSLLRIAMRRTPPPPPPGGHTPKEGS